MTDDPLAFVVFNEIGIIDQLGRALFESVLPAGMTIAQFTVLNHFVRLGGERSPAALAAAFQVTRPTMTSTLGRLHASGMVAIRQSPDDGRGKLVSITEAGRAMREDCIARLKPPLSAVETAVGHDLLNILKPQLSAFRALLDGMR